MDSNPTRHSCQLHANMYLANCKIMLMKNVCCDFISYRFLIRNKDILFYK